MSRPVSACCPVLGPQPSALSRTKPPASHYLRESNKARHVQVEGDLAKPEGDVRWRPLLVRALGALSLCCADWSCSDRPPSFALALCCRREPASLCANP